jgi:hypothetical protein
MGKRRSNKRGYAQARARAWMRKLQERGPRGYPVVTVALYGPDDQLATKLVAAYHPSEEEGMVAMERWFGSDLDVRRDPVIQDALAQRVLRWKPQSVVATDRILGCPHEQGVDYEGDYCPDPACAYWLGRDRWTGELVDPEAEPGTWIGAPEGEG